jgi:hypothetical protein
MQNWPGLLNWIKKGKVKDIMTIAPLAFPWRIASPSMATSQRCFPANKAIF